MDFTSIKKQLNYEVKNGNYSSSVGLVRLLLTNSSEHELPGLYYYLYKLISPEITNHDLKNIKIAFITSFVTRPIESYLTIEGFLSGYNIQTYLAHFYNYQKEIIDKESDLNHFSPDVVVIFLRSEDLLKNISITNYNEIDNDCTKVYNHIKGIISSIAENNSNKCFFILHSINYPIHSVREISKGQFGGKIKQAIDNLNSNLQKINNPERPLYYFDQNYFSYLYGYKNIYNETSNLVSQNPFNQTTYMYLAKEYIRYVFMHSGESLKCIAIDADDTLWGGTISEDGINNIQIGNYYPGNVYVEFQKYLLEFYNRGIILILLSKNDIDDIMNVLENNQNMILKKEHFTLIKANWNKKGINLKVAVEELNIGIDSVLFIDNDIHERNEMRSICPNVKILELPSSFEKYKQALMDSIISEKNEIAPEDLKRNELYYRKKQRKIHEEKFTSLKEYYSSLNMKCNVSKVEPLNLGRVHDLLQRTNQFNLTTKRYSLSDLKKLSNDPNINLYYYTYADIYGDDGVIGLIFIKKDIKNKIWEIDTFLMSCRVIGKTIEDAIINHFLLKAQKYNINFLVGTYIPTPKNKQISNLYEKYGFTKVKINNNTQLYKWEIPVSNRPNIECEWITITEI